MKPRCKQGQAAKQALPDKTPSPERTTDHTATQFIGWRKKMYSESKPRPRLQRGCFYRSICNAPIQTKD